MSPEATHKAPGRLVLVVGPSGAGKDTLMRLAAGRLEARPDVVFPRRLVTRESGPFEDHDTIDEAGFAAGLAQGTFPLAWRAHGLGYALPPSVRDNLEQGMTVVANVSRGVVADARRQFPVVEVVLITAPVEELARRVAARGREVDAAARVSRAAPGVETIAPDLVIQNVGEPVTGAEALSAFLSRQSPAVAR